MEATPTEEMLTHKRTGLLPRYSQITPRLEVSSLYIAMYKVALRAIFDGVILSRFDDEFPLYHSKYLSSNISFDINLCKV